MENLDFTPSEVVKKYNTQAWRTTFNNHGIQEKYFDSWFFNYEPKNQLMTDNLEKLKVLARRNTSIALLGDIGMGKTHLAMAILKDSIICGLDKMQRKKAKYIDQNQKEREHWSYSKPDGPGRYYTMTELFRKFRESITDKTKSESDFMDDHFSMKCLIIDEIQIRSDSDSEKRMLQELIDARYARNKQTVFVGNMSLISFKNAMGKRLCDRMHENGLEVLIFTGESYRRKKS